MSSDTHTPTPHNAAKYGDIASTVIMPGDPLRAKYIAENFLENPVMYNSIRGMFGYTGTYKGKRVSVQGHGMGIPSVSIYTHELFNFYGVERIIRIGTCGTMQESVPMGSIILAQGSCTDSAYGNNFNFPGQFAAIADFGLLRKAAETSEAMNLPTVVGNILSSDVFYDYTGKQAEWAKFGVLGAEMESYGLYLNAAASGKKALAILTVTDNMVTKLGLSSEERQTGLNNMITLALEIA